MKLSEYVTIIDRGRDREHNDNPLLLAAVGLGGEAQELEAECERYARAVDAGQDTAEIRHSIMLEAGDAAWYAGTALGAVGHTVDELDRFEAHAHAMTVGAMLLAGGDAVPRALRALRRAAGELSEHIKKHHFHGVPLVPRTVSSRAGAALNAIAILAELHDQSLAQALAANVAKCRLRYPERYGAIEVTAAEAAATVTT